MVLSLLATASEKSVRANYKSGWNYQSGIIRFEKDDLKVTFISAIHIAPKQYYDGLNKHFKNYDLVLYETVTGYQEALKESGVQQSPWDVLAGKLNFVSQLKSINYQAANFVHADMKFKDLLSLENVKKEDILNPQKMKLIIEQFKQAPASVLMGFYRNVFTGKELKNPIIISARNSHCMKVLNEKLPNHKNLAIFYGAAHFLDIKKRLMKEGFKPSKTVWITVYKEDGK